VIELVDVSVEGGWVVYIKFVDAFGVFDFPVGVLIDGFD